MSADQLQIWGILPDDFERSDLADLARTWAELVTPPADDGIGYPYRVSVTSGDSERDRATGTDAVKDAFDTAVAGQLGTAHSGRTVQYDRPPITVTLYGPEQFHLAPAWEVWVDATLLRATDESVAATRRERIVALVNEAHEVTGALFTFAHATTDPYDASIHPDRESLLDGDLSPLSWLSVISSQLVERVGRERLLGVPVGDVRERIDGSVTLSVFENPLDRDTDALRAVERHLAGEIDT